VLAQTTAIQRCMQSVMRPGEHYGVIPGTTKPGEKPKPTLLQPGADKLGLMFHLRPEYEIVSRTETDTFIAREVRCRLYHIQTGECWGEGMGSANSREAKYQNQAMAKVCPKCSKPAIIRGKEEYGGGWICFTKKDGCGAKFKADDKAITEQSGQVNADKLWDLHNTITKMANKRARVAAVLTATAASDIFAQDLEDLEEMMPSKPAVVEATVVVPAQPTLEPPPADADAKAKNAKVRACAIAIKDAGIPEAERKAWMSDQLGKPVGSSKDLSISELDMLIGRANSIRQPGADDDR